MTECMRHDRGSSGTPPGDTTIEFSQCQVPFHLMPNRTRRSRASLRVSVPPPLLVNNHHNHVTILTITSVGLDENVAPPRPANPDLLLEQLANRAALRKHVRQLRYRPCATSHATKGCCFLTPPPPCSSHSWSRCSSIRIWRPTRTAGRTPSLISRLVVVSEMSRRSDTCEICKNFLLIWPRLSGATSGVLERLLNPTSEKCPR
jgi:hypothetical protein